nr:MAG TPA: Sensory rhodopsin II, Sensory rhodopsin PROTEIN COMPLEX, SIGNAL TRANSDUCTION [Caudoviricetes sp.]
MLAVVVTFTLILAPFVILLGIWVLALVAEYTANPVIELVEEYRKKYSHTNENYQLSERNSHVHQAHQYH